MHSKRRRLSLHLVQYLRRVPEQPAITVQGRSWERIGTLLSVIHHKGKRIRAVGSFPSSHFASVPPRARELVLGSGSEWATTIKTWKIPLAVPQNEYVFPKPRIRWAESVVPSESLRISRTWEPLWFSCSDDCFSSNTILKHKPTNSTKETKIYSKAGGYVGVVKITDDTLLRAFQG